MNTLRGNKFVLIILTIIISTSQKTIWSLPFLNLLPSTYYNNKVASTDIDEPADE